MSYMDLENETRVSEFILLGLSEDTEVQPLLFALFLTIYLVTLIGNLFIVLATISDAHLHMPMYFFLANLSFADICFTSMTVPNMLVNIQIETKTMSYGNSLTEMYFFMVFVGLDSFLSIVMAYYCYVAICHPLHYTVIMNPRVCGLLLLALWMLSVLNSLLHGLMVLLDFLYRVGNSSLFCELSQVIQVACSDTFLNVIVINIASGILGGIPLTGILFSYSKIICSILRISSCGGKHKAFSTCGSHLSVVSLFHNTAFRVYLSSVATQNTRASAVVAMMFTVVTPILNPFIYSVRNKDIKHALKIISR